MATKSTRSPDWESLIKRLTAVAFGWFYDRRCSDDESVLPGTGMSARDLAYNAILELLKNEGQYNPKSDEDRFRLIYTIMWRDFIDLVRKGRAHDRTVILDAAVDAEGRSELENLPDTRDDFVSAEAASVARSLYPLTDGDPQLKNLIDAVAMFDRSDRDEQADMLGVTATEITNMKKRLKYRRATRHPVAHESVES